jgi:hypothetical protein
MVQVVWRPILRESRRNVIRHLEKEASKGKIVHTSSHFLLTCVPTDPETQSATPKP